MSKSEIIRTLGMYQPFAGLMLHGKIETRWVIRGKKPPFPLGKYLIYSTMKFYTPSEVGLIAGHQYSKIKELRGDDKPRLPGGVKQLLNPEFTLTGHALCIADLEKIIYVLPTIDSFGEQMAKDTFVTYRGPQTDNKGITRLLVGLIFKNVQAIEPFPFKGKQGVGILSEADKSKIILK